MARTHRHLPSALLGLSFVACSVEPADRGAGREETEHAHHEDELVAEVKISEGATVRFFASEDGSAGVLETVTSGPALGEDPDLDSIADLYWALTEEGVEVPEALMRHHRAMAADAGRSELFRRARGSLLHELRARAVLFDGINPCTNAEFSANHCGLANYPDGPDCIFNTGGDPWWSTGHTSRFKAGFCLQAGQAYSVLSYEHIYPDCLSCRVIHGVWGGGSWDPTLFSATTYLTWTWIGPSGASKRVWDHVTEGGSGAVYDWATRFKVSNSCDEI